MEQLKQEHNPFLNLSPGNTAEIELISICFRGGGNNFLQQSL